ncbi:MAG: hypothetical protein AAFR44_10270 [Pseudomonadota bacterium]
MSTEFVLVAVFLFGLLGVMVEGGIHMARSAGFERSLEMVVRDLRVGIVSPAEATARLCDAPFMPPSCQRDLVLEVEPFTADLAMGPRQATQCDRARRRHRARGIVVDDPLGPALAQGALPPIRVVSACLAITPMVPLAGVLAGLAPQPDGQIALVARRAFVAEGI